MGISVHIAEALVHELVPIPKPGAGSGGLE